MENTFKCKEDKAKALLQWTLDLMNCSYQKGYEDGTQKKPPQTIQLPANSGKQGNHGLPAAKTIRKREKRLTEKHIRSWLLLISIGILEALALVHLVPAVLVLVIDGHGEPYFGKYPGKGNTYVKSGQSEKWTHGKSFHTISCLSPNLFLNFSYSYTSKVPAKDKPFPKELLVLQETILALFAHGFRVKLVMGDRGYFDARFFSLAKLAMWPNAPEGFVPPFMDTPRQYSGAGSTKEGRKIEAAQNELLGIYSRYLMKIGNSDKKKLRRVWDPLEFSEKKDGKLFPVYQAFYRNKMRKYRYHSDKDFAQDLVNLAANCSRFEEELVAVKEELTQVRALHDLKPLKGEPRKWSHREPDLHQCLQKYHKLKQNRDKAVKKREYLLNHIFCLIIALPDGMSPETDLPSVETLIQLYAFRWRIENIFKAIKEDFHLPCSSRSPIRFLLHYAIGALYWNNYVFCNCLKWREFRIAHHKWHQLDKRSISWTPLKMNDWGFHPCSRTTFKLEVSKQILIDLLFPKSSAEKRRS